MGPQHFRSTSLGTLYSRPMELLLGLGHQMRSGKDTAAEILVAERGFTRFAFADILREYAYRINPVVLLSSSDVERLPPGPKRNVYESLKADGIAASHPERLAEIVDLVGWEEAKAVSGIRNTLQELGHHGREMIGKNVWVDALFSAVAASEAERVVISDVRYDNEAERIRQEGGATVHVRRDTADDNSEASGHPSEHGLSALWADYELDNDSTLEAFKEKVLGLADSLLEHGDQRPALIERCLLHRAS